MNNFQKEFEKQETEQQEYKKKPKDNDICGMLLKFCIKYWNKQLVRDIHRNMNSYIDL